MPVQEVRRLEEVGREVRAEVVASPPDRRVTVTVERVGEKQTRVSVEVKKFLGPDRATARAVVEQIAVEMGRKN
jgi:hypothetical protein